MFVAPFAVSISSFCVCGSIVVAVVVAAAVVVVDDNGVVVVVDVDDGDVVVASAAAVVVTDLRNDFARFLRAPTLFSLSTNLPSSVG